MLIPCLAYASILKTEAVCTAEKSVKVYQTTRRHIPKTVLFTAIAVRTSNPTQIGLYSVCEMLCLFVLYSLKGNKGIELCVSH
jgi:hypothetical protein